MRIRVGDPLEIYTDNNGEVIFKKYSPVGEMSDCAKELCESMTRVSGMTAAISDRESIIAASGMDKKELFEKRLSREIVEAMEERRTIHWKSGDRKLPVVDGAKPFAGVVAPIISEGDVSGCVIFAANENESVTEAEYKLAGAISTFLGKQMES